MTKWNLDQIPNLKDKVAIVTGGNSGIGFYTALELGRHNATVYLACRNKAKAEEAITELILKSKNGNFIYKHLDVSSLESIKQFADDLRSEIPKIDILVNNAGIMDVKTLKLTKDGFESHMGTNHFGPFALTAHLIPLLKGGRIICVSSFLAKKGVLNLEDLNYTKAYDDSAAYCASKLANQLFINELQNTADMANFDITAISVHPGFSSTNLFNDQKSMKGLTATLRKFVFSQSAHKGALSSIYAATADDVIKGALYGPNGFKELKGNPTKLAPPPLALNKDLQQRLFDISEDLTRTKFKFE